MPGNRVKKVKKKRKTMISPDLQKQVFYKRMAVLKNCHSFTSFIFCPETLLGLIPAANPYGNFLNTVNFSSISMNSKASAAITKGKNFSV